MEALRSGAPVYTPAPERLMVAEAGRTAVVLLVRHGHTDAVGRRLVGRLPGVHLTSSGLEQARQLVARLAGHDLAAVYASPLERAVETAEPLAASRGLPIRTCDGLTEIDFGAWTGLTFEALDRLPAWIRFNAARGSADVPGGESPLAVQARAVAAVEAIAARHPGATVAAISHADVIRSVILHYTGRPLDRIEEIGFPPAAMAALRIGPGAGGLLFMQQDRER